MPLLAKSPWRARTVRANFSDVSRFLWLFCVSGFVQRTKTSLDLGYLLQHMRAEWIIQQIEVELDYN